MTRMHWQGFNCENRARHLRNPNWKSAATRDNRLPFGISTYWTKSILGISLLLLGACSPKSPTPLSEAQQAQRSASEFVDKTEESVENIGTLLENVDDQLDKLQAERDQLKDEVARQSAKIQQLEQEIERARVAKNDVESRLTNLHKEKSQLEADLFKEKQARTAAESKLSENQTPALERTGSPPTKNTPP